MFAPLFPPAASHATPWTAACQAPLSFIISWRLLKLRSIESVTPSSHCISAALFSFCVCIYIYIYTHTYTHIYGEGNGNPLQCFCLENPRDGGAWWAAVCGVAQSRTRLKRLSSSSTHIYILTTCSLTLEQSSELSERLSPRL